MIKIEVKSFNELTTKELYDVLQLRSEVFVVEQDCVYQDLDGNDEKAFHILGIKNNRIIAYTRIFKPGDYFTDASIGRVAVAKNERRYSYGMDIMKASIKAIHTHFKETTIKVSAQTYLREFYKKFGFKAIGDTYLEDNIPHIAMIKK
ncbi:GNAT family N-acetyltransferase [Mariniflexile ostreae]|uniref:GNAT family N-acetyltransferase n=1 Tax=Mariniflexile ostreae TaxID=1520892 RepID=A0ABV5FBL9_9FLAO